MFFFVLQLVSYFIIISVCWNREHSDSYRRFLSKVAEVQGCGCLHSLLLALLTWAHNDHQGEYEN